MKKDVGKKDSGKLHLWTGSQCQWHDRWLCVDLRSVCVCLARLHLSFGGYIVPACDLSRCNIAIRDKRDLEK